MMIKGTMQHEILQRTTLIEARGNCRGASTKPFCFRHRDNLSYSLVLELDTV